MPRASTHRLGAALAVFSVHAAHEKTAGKQTLAPFASAALADVSSTLPDLIEPACHPNHRQFFHSITFLAIVGVGLHKLFTWEPEDEIETTLKWGLVAVAGAYGVHLLMDACTRKSLPLVGKL